MLKLFDFLAKRLPSPTAAWIGTLAVAVGLSVSKILLSCGLMLIVLDAFVYLIRQKRLPDLRNQLWVWALMGVFLWSVMGYVYTTDHVRWWRDAVNKLPFFVIPIAYLALPAFSKKQGLYVLGLFQITQLVLLLLTFRIWVFDPEAWQMTLAHNSGIDIPGSISHIYFGVLLAISVLIGLQLAFRSPVNRTWKWIFGLISLIQFAGLHVLGSRTGFLGLYAGLLAWLFLEIFSRKAWIFGAFLLIALTLTPILAYQYVYSFRVRVTVTIWDIEQYSIKGVDLSNLSAARRLVTWESAWDIFKENPVIGTGMGDVKQALFDQYSQKQVRISPDQWLSDAHNGYLQALAGTGLVGFLLNVLALILPFIVGWRQNKPLMLSIPVLYAVALLTESLWQREIGVNGYLFPLLWGWIFHQINENEPGDV